MQIPDNVSDVGWYRFGPAPGSASGSAVLTGHVDDYRQGVGVFGRTGDLGPGDIVKVTDAGGVTRQFSVVAREEWAQKRWAARPALRSRRQTTARPDDLRWVFQPVDARL